MYRPALLLMLLIVPVAPLHAAGGVTHVRSAHDVSTTLDRLEAAAVGKGMTVFARIDHAAGAAKAGQALPPTQLLLFGNPSIGTRLMQCDRGSAIDLPLKALAWEDAEGKVWLSYNTPDYLAHRHQLQTCAGVLDKMRSALASFAKAAASP
ncbi:DUF302 domain-containing protein [Motiliproteus sediminis]|uniref:DUF302 domain-containing protein n=1 Tax=Motiliproteus sediminis TaxID=1468178 RepID=UPI001FE92A13|nr:DUF302 domain-containing protein [Motiliproteus sediminis]